MDVLGLPDAVQPPDALFQKFGMKGQIEQHQMMGELEIASLAADFRTDQQAGAAFFGEPGGVAVPLHQGQAFVEQGRFDVDEPAEGFVDCFDLISRTANQQNLLRRQTPEFLGQP